jgi:hypothetical protein
MATQQMNEVDLRSYLLPKHRSVFSALQNLGVSIGHDGWCLVGGLMVLVVGAAGRRSEGTKDGDVVVDIAADPRMVEIWRPPSTPMNSFGQQARFASLSRVTRWGVR